MKLISVIYYLATLPARILAWMAGAVWGGVLRQAHPGMTATDPLDTPLWVRPRLDWIIVGGESGPNARPMHPDWVRSLRNQCAAAGVKSAGRLLDGALHDAFPIARL